MSVGSMGGPPRGGGRPGAAGGKPGGGLLRSGRAKSPAGMGVGAANMSTKNHTRNH